MSEDLTKIKWYVVRAVSGQEKKVKAYLEKEISNYGLQDYVEEVLVPSHKVFQIRKMKDGKTKKIAVEKNYFPGYVMVKADITHGEVVHIIKGVPGIIGFPAVDGKNTTDLPRPMREEEVKRILGKVSDANEFEVTYDTAYLVSEQVKVIDGPFNGFTGTIEEVFEEKKKLNVMVKIFGRNTPVELNYSQVEKVE